MSPTGGMTDVDWTLPSPTAESFSIGVWSRANPPAKLPSEDSVVGVSLGSCSVSPWLVCLGSLYVEPVVLPWNTGSKDVPLEGVLYATTTVTEPPDLRTPKLQRSDPEPAAEQAPCVGWPTKLGELWILVTRKSFEILLG